MKSKKSIGNGIFRVTAEISQKNKQNWVVFLTFPGKSRYFLRDNEDKVRRFDNHELALLAGAFAFPGVLSDYCEKCADSAVGAKGAIEAAEAMFSIPKQDSDNFLVEHKVNKSKNVKGNSHA